MPTMPLVSGPVRTSLTVVLPRPCLNPFTKPDTISPALPTSIPFTNYGSTLLPHSRPSSTLSSTPSILDADLLPTAAANQLTTAKSPSANDGAGSPSNPQRPPIRPAAGTRSKFDLEHNPFEQSFSRSSHHSSSSERTTPPRGGDATSIKHNALPPLSSLTSPAAADPSQFPWLANQSLRTGPLSPAMLAGPQQQGANQPHNPSGLRNGTNEAAPSADAGFDSSTFRTGFTPGTGSGFTPAYNTLMGGNFSALPLPSPNTAAFLNMVTNATPIGEGGDGANANVQGGSDQQHPGQAPSAIPPHLQQHHGLSHLAPQPDMAQDTITPNTLSALTGVFNDMNRANQAGPAPPPPPNFFQPMHPHPGQQQQPHPGPGMPQVDYAQQSANAASQAANGLFLLSQAHQELSKREEEQVRGGSGHGPGPGHGQGQGQGHGQGKRASGLGHPVPGPGIAGMQVPGAGPGNGKPLNGSVAGQKRKSDGGPKPPEPRRARREPLGTQRRPSRQTKELGRA
ncbi:hypothetical protein EHS25_006402 [Saitozyma podzolica]|uniref:Transcription factor Aft1 HRA domain-containing protein n=1 Tax=Saitozyma podzolica TaxID=1890683 RepID=A0A427YRK2_9TREE|nr:hypothetical protein EHS25_006402 [Saitozyma podzolica]